MQKLIVLQPRQEGFHNVIHGVNLIRELATLSFEEYVELAEYAAG